MKIPILSSLLSAVNEALDPQKKRGTATVKSAANKSVPTQVSENKPVSITSILPSITTFGQRLEQATTVSDCMSLYQNYASGSSEEDQAASKAFKIAATFEDYFTILEKSDIESGVAKRAVIRLQNLSQTFDEWRQLLDYIKADASFAEVATICRKGLISKSNSLEQWLYIYQDSPEHSTEKATAQAELLKSVQSSDDWDTIINDIPDTDPLHRKRLEWRLDHADNLESIETLYDELSENDSLIPAVLAKLNQRTDELSEWIERYENHNSKDSFDDVVFEKMLALAQSPSDFIEVMQAVENCHEDDVNKVLEHLRGLSWSKENWATLRDDASDDGSLEHLSFEKLLEFETTTVDILRFYLEYVDGWSEDSEVVEKIFDRLFKVATPQEVAIISLLAENEHDDLHEAAQKIINPSAPESSSESE